MRQNDSITIKMRHFGAQVTADYYRLLKGFQSIVCLFGALALLCLIFAFGLQSQ